MRREQQEGIRGRHLLPPTAEDLARDLLAEIAACYAHVPLSAPVACGHAYLAAVRRAVAAEAQAAELEAAIRSHRDQHGDDRCWKDHETLYAVLPEGYIPPVRDSTIELENCKRYIASCYDPRTEYVSPQRRIEELEAQVAELQALVRGLSDRVAAQSELLARRSEHAMSNPMP